MPLTYSLTLTGVEEPVKMEVILPTTWHGVYLYTGDFKYGNSNYHVRISKQGDGLFSGYIYLGNGPRSTTFAKAEHLPFDQIDRKLDESWLEKITTEEKQKD